MNGKGIIAIATIGVCFILFMVLNPMVQIDAGHRGVVLRWGAVTDTILDEGIHWVTPIVNSVVEMDVTVQKEERQSSASSKDLQQVSTQVTINYELDKLKVNTIYQNLRGDFSARIISPAIEEFVKKTTAQYTAEELITKRESVKTDLKNALTENLAKNHILVSDIFITDFNFSDEFNKAIEAKVTAEQTALGAKNKLEQVKYEAEQQVTQARAEAESIRIQAQAVTQQGGKDYVQLKAIEKWNGELPAQMIPGSTVPFINLHN